MKGDPFDKFDKPSEYLLPGEDEKQIISKIKNRVSTSSKVKSIIPTKWVIGIAASLLLISIYFLLQPKMASNQQLVESYFKPYKNYQIEQTRGPIEMKELTEAYEAYDEQKYELAINNFDKVSIKDPLDRLYYAISLQGLEKWTLAQEILSNLEHEIPLEHKDAWSWHTALNLIMVGQNDRSILLLSDLSDGTSQFKSQAAELIKKLN